MIELAESPKRSLEPVLRELSILTTRAQMAGALGESYGGDRNLYTALGYKLNPVYEDFKRRYDRGDIAAAIIDAPVDACWAKAPRITESAESETPFEKAWTNFAQEMDVWTHLAAVDKVASLGNYAVLYLGFEGDPENKVTIGTPQYLSVFAQPDAIIQESFTNPSDANYGKPQFYQLTSRIDQTVRSFRVHAARTIHVAEDTLTDPLNGRPRLERVYNRLQDLDLVLGGSSEMFWRGAFPGLAFKIEKDARVIDSDLEEMRDQIEEYVHGLKRFLRLKGVDVENLALQVADPSGHVTVLMQVISGSARIPIRILIGSERGELASSQDEHNWLGRTDERRTNHCEPKILRPFIKKLIQAKVLPEPKERYQVEWPTLVVEGPKEKAEIGQLRSRALADYTRTPGTSKVLPPKMFLRKCLDMTETEVAEAEAQGGAQEPPPPPTPMGATDKRVRDPGKNMPHIDARGKKARPAGSGRSRAR